MNHLLRLAQCPQVLPLAGSTFGWRVFIGKADAHGMFPSELKAVILLGESQEFPLGFQLMRESSARHHSFAIEIILGCG